MAMALAVQNEEEDVEAMLKRLGVVVDEPSNGHEAIVRALMDSGADVNKADNDGRTQDMTNSL